MNTSTILKLLFGLAAIAFFAGFCYGLRDARDAAPVKKIEVKVMKNFDLLTEIQKAQELLEDEDAGYYIKDVPMSSKTKKGHGKKARTIIKRWKVQKLEDFNILLAVENIRRPEKGIEVIKLERKGARAPYGFSVDFDKLNGVNTEFKVTYPNGYVVLGLKRVVQLGKGFEEVVYTPYTKEIDTPEMRKLGMQYLRQSIRSAEDDLRRRHVKSQAFKCLVADAVPTDVSLVLSIIEHMDPAKFNRDIPVERLVDEVLVTVAANQGSAYQYAVSKAGARGLFQFIPRTYKSVGRLYPKAGLEKNFVEGMNLHENAAKASLLLFDSDLSYLRKEQRESLRNDPPAMGRYLAAAYNGGSSRAANAIRLHGTNWENRVLPETIVYLKKFRAVWKALDI